VYLATGIDGAVPRPVASSDPWGTFETQHQRNVLLGITDRQKATGFALAAQGADLEPVLAFTPTQLLARLRSEPYDLVVVHPRLIEAAGRPWEFLDAVRSCGCPVLVLGAEPSRRVGSVTASREVIRGVTRLLPAREEAERVSWGPLELHPSRRQAWWRSEPLQLTPAQFRILTVLVDAAGALVTNQELARRVWGSEGQFDGQRIFAHIRRIRKKIESDPANPRFLLTIRGEGFRLAV
jgi:DNA-binding response OmpR family regulator